MPAHIFRIFRIPDIEPAGCKSNIARTWYETSFGLRLVLCSSGLSIIYIIMRKEWLI